MSNNNKVNNFGLQSVNKKERIKRNKAKLMAAKPGELPVSSFYDHAVKKGYERIIKFCESKMKKGE